MTTALSPQDVTVLTLTYGARSDLLAQMLAAVSAEGVTRVLVFGNGLSADVAARIRALALPGGGEVTLIESPRNLGSAPGYARLMEQALDDPRTGAVWFLDDDNIPEPGCLAHLLAAQAGPQGGAVTALRRDRDYMLRAAKGEHVRLPRSGEAFGKDLRDLAARILRKLTGGGGRIAARPGPVVPFPSVPYGGLLVPADLARAEALPRSEFVLYADDYEYSGRLSAGPGLYLVPEAFVTDVEQSWNASGSHAPQRSQVVRLATMAPDFRMYYALRNTLYLDRCRTRALTWPWFLINLIWLGLGISLAALIRGRTGNIRCLLEAMRDGVGARLGPNPAYPLPS